MGKWLLLATLVLVGLIVVYRERIFLRDPLAHVEVNGQAQQNLRVFINYSNDVMVQSPDLATSYIVQGWNKLPGIPANLTCVQGLMCLTEADHAPVSPLVGPKHEPKVQMTTKQVSFIDGDGALVKVTLR